MPRVFSFGDKLPKVEEYFPPWEVNKAFVPRAGVGGRPCRQGNWGNDIVRTMWATPGREEDPAPLRNVGVTF